VSIDPATSRPAATAEEPRSAFVRYRSPIGFEYDNDRENGPDGLLYGTDTEPAVLGASIARRTIAHTTRVALRARSGFGGTTGSESASPAMRMSRVGNSDRICVDASADKTVAVAASASVRGRHRASRSLAVAYTAPHLLALLLSGPCPPRLQLLLELRRRRFRFPRAPDWWRFRRSGGMPAARTPHRCPPADAPRGLPRL
jgi:hypothetical protein